MARGNGRSARVEDVCGDRTPYARGGDWPVRANHGRLGPKGVVSWVMAARAAQARMGVAAPQALVAG